MITSRLRRRSASASACAAIAGAAVFFALPARADTDEQRAVSLFEKGRKLARDGNCVDAIPPLLESVRYVEGVGPLLNLGTCYEALGKTASAHRWFARAEEVASTKKDPRRDEAAQRASALEKGLPMLTVHVAPAVRASAEVRVDGETWPRERWEVPIPIDPGTHDVELRTPPDRVETHPLHITQGQHLDVTLVPVPPASSLSPAAPAEKKQRSAPTLATNDAPMPGQRKLALALGGVGLAGTLVGSLFGALSIRAHGRVVDACPQYPTCTSGANNDAIAGDNRDASHDGTISTVAIVAGLALLASGTALWFTAPER
jgi:hypothetical protein